MEPKRTDARQRRTWRTLSETVLQLAAEQPIDEISVTALAKAAGIHRSTVYQHAQSPGELLAAVLQEELDALHEQIDRADPHNLDEELVAVFLELLAHIERHEAIYKRELGCPQSALNHMLAEHYQGSLCRIFEAYDLRLPADLGISRQDMLPLASAWMAAGSVEVVRSWLDTPRPRDTDWMVRAHAAMMPSWWPSEQGATPAQELPEEG